jgi:TetR/AcrR family transcriptional regulator of autoinduction and epiphytic fitness
MKGSPATRREYRSPERRERRNRTQQTILDAAEEQFRQRGYGAATMQAVAERAGVSLPTVYLYFASKPDLVRGLADRVSGSAELSVGQVLSEGDQNRQLEVGAGILRRVHQRSAVVADILRAAAGADAELSAEWQRWQRGHLDAVGAVAELLAARGALRDDIDVNTATDILYTVGGRETFRQLVNERGWSPTRYEKWLVDACKRLLLSTQLSPNPPTEVHPGFPQAGAGR